jgi:hypothetical protein
MAWCSVKKKAQGQIYLYDMEKNTILASRYLIYIISGSWKIAKKALEEYGYCELEYTIILLLNVATRE